MKCIIELDSTEFGFIHLGAAIFGRKMTPQSIDISTARGYWISFDHSNRPTYQSKFIGHFLLVCQCPNWKFNWERAQKKYIIEHFQYNHRSDPLHLFALTTSMICLAIASTETNAKRRATANGNIIWKYYCISLVVSCTLTHTDQTPFSIGARVCVFPLLSDV